MTKSRDRVANPATYVDIIASESKINRRSRDLWILQPPKEAMMEKQQVRSDDLPNLKSSSVDLYDGVSEQGRQVYACNISRYEAIILVEHWLRQAVAFDVWWEAMRTCSGSETRINYYIEGRLHSLINSGCISLAEVKQLYADERKRQELDHEPAQSAINEP